MAKKRQTNFRNTLINQTRRLVGAWAQGLAWRVCAKSTESRRLRASPSECMIPAVICTRRYLREQDLAHRGFLSELHTRNSLASTCTCCHTILPHTRTSLASTWKCCHTILPHTRTSLASTWKCCHTILPSSCCKS